MGTEWKSTNKKNLPAGRISETADCLSTNSKNIPAPKSRRKAKREIVKDIQLSSSKLGIEEFRSLFSLTTAQIAYFSFERAISTEQPLERILDTIWSSSSRCIEANPAFAAARGLNDASVILGKSFAELFPPNETNFAIVKEWIESDFQLATHENIETMPDGQERVNQISVYARVQQNLIKNLWVIVKDLTKNRDFVLEIKAAEEHYRTLVERPGLILVRVKPGEEIVYISPNVENIVNYNASDIIANPTLIRRLLHPDDIKQQYRLVRARKELNTNTVEAEYRVRHKDRSYHWLYERQTPKLNANGEVEYYDSIILDIQERKQLEAQLVHAQRMETMGTFAQGIAHEFNNRLAAILGQISLSLKELDPSNSCYSRLAAAEQAAMCCAEMTRTLVTFGSSEEQCLEPLSIAKMLDDTVQLLGHLLPSSIEIALIAASSLTPARGNYTALQQVLVNLAINARDVMPQGGNLTFQACNVTIEKDNACSSFPSAQAGNYVEITVTDSGEGIPASNMPFIFDPFFSTKSNNMASGLGLSTAYSIIKSHEGFIRVSNSKGGGTAFTFILPACEEEKPIDNPGDVIEILGGKETILVAEDDPMVLQMVKSALSLHGYKVVSAADGLEAVNMFKARHKKIDLALIDQTMPKLSGREVLNEIYAISPDMKILLTSGYGACHMDIAGERKQPHFISKPYRLTKLLKKIRELIDQE